MTDAQRVSRIGPQKPTGGQPRPPENHGNRLPGAVAGHIVPPNPSARVLTDDHDPESMVHKRQSSYRLSAPAIERLDRLTELLGLQKTGVVEVVARQAAKVTPWGIRDSSVRRLVEQERAASSPMPPYPIRMTAGARRAIESLMQEHGLSSSEVLEILLYCRDADERGGWTPEDGEQDR